MSPSTVYFNGLANVEIPPVDSSSYIHVRLPPNSQVQILSLSSQLKTVMLDNLPGYHLLSEVLKGNETVLAQKL